MATDNYTVKINAVILIPQYREREAYLNPYTVEVVALSNCPYRSNVIILPDVLPDEASPGGWLGLWSQENG